MSDTDKIVGVVPGVDFDTFIPRFDGILARGLTSGMGKRDGQMCIEAAVCAALGLPHGDNPPCVEEAVRTYKIVLNDSQRWPSASERAKGLRDLGIAQVGSKGVVDGVDFTTRLAKETIQVLIPRLFREIFPDNKECLAAADRCGREGTADAARYAAVAARYAAGYAADAADAAADAAGYAAGYAARYAADAAGYAAGYAADAAGYAAGDAARYAAGYAARYAARYAAVAARYAANAARYAANAARYAAGYAADAADAAGYLILSAKLATQALIELGSPGAKYITIPEI